MQNALDCFEKSLKHGGFDQNLKLRALFWKGEAYYRLGDFNKAIGLYQEFKNAPSSFINEEYALCDYNIGYSWFRLKNYTKCY